MSTAGADDTQPYGVQPVPATWKEKEALLSKSEEVNRSNEEGENHAPHYGPFHPKRALFRWLFLVLACLLSFGSYFCYDNPAALQSQIQEELGVNAGQYQILYTVYSIPNTVIVFFGGFLIDRVFGVRFGGFLFALITTAGQVVFALGGSIKSFPLMIVGRAIFGLGGESITVAQNFYVSRTFKGKELAMALGITLSVSRIGSAVNMNVMPPIADASSLGAAFWFGAIICGLSLATAIGAALMDRYSERVIRAIDGTTKEEEEASAGETINMKEILFFPLSFWLLCIICVLYYAAVFPFYSVASDYFQDNFKYSPAKASSTAGWLYTVSAVVSPFLGFLVDRVGWKPIFLLGACLGTVGVHCLFAFTCLIPVVPIVILGVTYSVAAAALWPCIPHLVRPQAIGTAYGLIQAIQNAGLAGASQGTGAVKDSSGYDACMVMFMALSGGAALFSLWLIFEDFRKGLILSKSVKSPSVSDESAESQVKYAFFGRPEALFASHLKNFVYKNPLMRPRTAESIRSSYLLRLGVNSAGSMDHVPLSGYGSTSSSSSSRRPVGLLDLEHTTSNGGTSSVST